MAPTLVSYGDLRVLCKGVYVLGDVVGYVAALWRLLTDAVQPQRWR